MSSPSTCCYRKSSADDCSMDSKIRCMGPCNAYIHLTCVNITKAMLKAFDECAELHFYCRICQRYSTVAVRESIDNFSANINTLSEALKPLTSINFNELVKSL